MQIADGICRLPSKYNQLATALNLEKMVLTVTLLYTWLSIFSTQLADSPVPELSH